MKRYMVERHLPDFPADQFPAGGLCFVLATKLAALGVFALLAAVSAATAQSHDTGTMVTKITIALKQQNKSGQSGTATLTGRGDGTFDVVIRMSPPKRFPGASQNAHIHKVTCARYARMKSFNAQLATVVDGLSNLTKGKSKTNVPSRLSKRTTGTYAINVHEQNPPYTVVACGNIPKS